VAVGIAGPADDVAASVVPGLVVAVCVGRLNGVIQFMVILGFGSESDSRRSRGEPWSRYATRRRPPPLRASQGPIEGSRAGEELAARTTLDGVFVQLLRVARPVE
jgi:hypothetical protein